MTTLFHLIGLSFFGLIWENSEHFAVPVKVSANMTDRTRASGLSGANPSPSDSICIPKDATTPPLLEITAPTPSPKLLTSLLPIPSKPISLDSSDYDFAEDPGACRDEVSPSKDGRFFLDVGQLGLRAILRCAEGTDEGK